MYLLIAGLFLLISSLLTSIVSSDFVYGMGHADRPIPWVLAFLGLGFLGYWAGVWIVTRKPPDNVHQGLFLSKKVQLGFILFVAVVCRLIYFPSQMQRGWLLRLHWKCLILPHPHQKLPNETC